MEDLVERFKQWCKEEDFELDLEAAAKALPDKLPLAPFTREEVSALALRLAEEDLLVEYPPIKISKHRE